MSGDQSQLSIMSAGDQSQANIMSASDQSELSIVSAGDQSQASIHLLHRVWVVGVVVGTLGHGLGGGALPVNTGPAA